MCRWNGRSVTGDKVEGREGEREEVKENRMTHKDRQSLGRERIRLHINKLSDLVVHQINFSKQ